MQSSLKGWPEGDFLVLGASLAPRHYREHGRLADGTRLVAGSLDDVTREAWARAGGLGAIALVLALVSLAPMAGTPCAFSNGNCLSNDCTGTGDTCQPGNALAACDADADCLSNACESNVCQEGAAGTPCAFSNANCLSKDCGGSDDTCQAGSASAACDTDADCLSNACVKGVCQEGAAGTPCDFDNDNCASGECAASTDTCT
jgi:hypothetical protein